MSKWTASLLERLVTLKRWLIYWSVLDSEKTVKYEIFFIERETLYILLFLGYILGIFGWKFYNLKILPVCWQNCGRFKIGRWWWWPKDVANCRAGQSNILVLILDIFFDRKKRNKWCQLPGRAEQFFYFDFWYVFFDRKKRKKGLMMPIARQGRAITWRIETNDPTLLHPRCTRYKKHVRTWQEVQKQTNNRIWFWL